MKPRDGEIGALNANRTAAAIRREEERAARIAGPLVSALDSISGIISSRFRLDGGCCRAGIHPILAGIQSIPGMKRDGIIRMGKKAPSALEHFLQEGARL